MHYTRWREHGEPGPAAPYRTKRHGPCRQDGCQAPAVSRQWCRKHYARVRRHGDPEQAAYIRGDDEARFWAHVEKSDGCWRWTGTVGGTGYAAWTFDGKANQAAYRYSYELLIGPIPAGLVIDHLCRNTQCVNPDHLEPVTNAENVLRGIGPTAINARKTECVHGHAYTSANTGINPTTGSRFCKACKADYQRRRRARLRAAR